MKFSQRLFDLPFMEADLASIFKQLHEKSKEEFPAWSLVATRRKLIGSFWQKASRHYLRLLTIGLGITIVLSGTNILQSMFAEIIPAAFVAFLSLVVSLYWKQYYDSFLPMLDNSMELYQGLQLQGIHQCKKEQYSVLTLMLIEYTERKIAALPDLPMNKETVQLLAKKYGVSVKSIEKALQVIVLGKWDKKSLRKRTEIEDDFDTAEEYFKELGICVIKSVLFNLNKRVVESG